MIGGGKIARVSHHAFNVGATVHCCVTCDLHVEHNCCPPLECFAGNRAVLRGTVVLSVEGQCATNHCPIEFDNPKRDFVEVLLFQYGDMSENSLG